MLPPSPTEYLVTIPKFDSVPAPVVEIEWKRSINEGQADAQRRKMPLLIFFVDPSNYYAKQLELDIFRDPEVARFVNRSFVPVKINLDEKPEWSQSILPIQRLYRYLEPGVDLAVTDLDGKLIDHFAVENPFQYSGPEVLVPFFISSLKKLSKKPIEDTLSQRQSDDIQSVVMAAAQPIPDFEKFSRTLESEMTFKNKGLFDGMLTKFRPNALRYMAKVGEAEKARDIVKKLATSPLYDFVDGGFFRESRTNSGTGLVDTSKTSSHNSLNAVVLAQLSCYLKDPELMALARDTGNEVITEFIQSYSVFASRLNDQDPLLISRRSSLTPSRITDLLSSSERALLQKYSSGELSPTQSLASLRSLADLSNPALTEFRQTLRQKIQTPPALSTPDQVSVLGYVAARLFDLYRYTGDTRYLNEARSLADEVYACWIDNSVYRTFGSREKGEGWLGSYLAFADCALADFAASGELYSLRQGTTAFKKAMVQFHDADTGLMLNTPPDPNSKFEFNSANPDVVDKNKESWNAMALHLAYSYSVVAESQADRSRFLEMAQSMSVRLNTLMSNASPGASGYFDAVTDLIQNRAVLIDGPTRVQDCLDLSKELPLVPIYPSDIAKDKKQTCYFIREGTILQGPFTKSEVTKQIQSMGLVQRL